MKLLIELFGEKKATSYYNYYKSEFPNMHEDYYVRQCIKLLKVI